MNVRQSFTSSLLSDVSDAVNITMSLISYTYSSNAYFKENIMKTANLKRLTIAGITASSLICLPAIAKDNHGNGHGKGNSAHISKDDNYNGYQNNGNARPNINAYRNASSNASFKRDLDKYGYRVVGKIDRRDYDRSVILDRYDDRYVRIRTPENKIVTVINDTLQIIDILNR